MPKTPILEKRTAIPDYSSQTITSDKDIRRFAEKLSKKFLNEYHIFDYSDNEIGMSIYVHDLRELISALNFISMRDIYPHRFKYRLRKIEN